ncbi:MAG: hypothetical protein D9V45_00895 [Chloroflexi bacterium]|nr:hypothetical protein [Anaerolinea sp.]TDA68207.1 MAG: hypothetical protein D9V45_00895 [Chloroflexota bacterium]
MTFTTQLFQSDNLVPEAYDPEKDAASEAVFSYDPNYATVIDWEGVPPTSSKWTCDILFRSKIARAEVRFIPFCPSA